MISVTILTKNSEKYLSEVLTSVQDFDEIVIFDSGSTDGTLSIAEQFPNVTVHKGKFSGFGPTHNTASSLAKNNWILSIDSDEIVSAEMNKEIASLTLEEDTVYSFPRDNYFNDKWIKWCGWYPDRQIRLYNRAKTRFSDAQVHEAVISSHLRKMPLKGAMIHYSYGSISDFLSKMQSYSELFAEQNQGKKKSSLFKAITHGFFAFFKSYILKKGFMGGYEGFVISSYNANTAFYKYLKLHERNQNLKKNPKVETN